MGRLVHDGNTKVHWLPAVADKAAPTVAEITAGDDLTPQIPSDGLNLTNPRNNASISMLDEAFNAEQVGTFGTAITLKFARDDSADTAWDLFSHKTSGFLLVSRFGAPEAASEVEVYPAESHDPAPLATAENEYQQYEVQLACTERPSIDAVVAA